MSRRAALLGLVLVLGCEAGAPGDASPEAASQAPSEVVAWLDGEPIRRDQISGPAAFRIYRHQVDIHSLLRREIERQADQTLLTREAERLGTTPEELLARAEARAAPVREAEVDAYLAERPQQAAGPEARMRVRHYLEETRRIEQRLALQSELRERADFRVVLEAPAQPRVDLDLDGAALRGPADAPVTIVHFASFGSRASAQSAERLRRLAQEFPGSFRQAHRDFLDQADERALLAARVAWLARQDGDFWALHDALFSHGARLDEAALARAAAASGLGEDALVRARSEPALLTRVKSDIDAGLAAGVPREPSLFVNGRYLSGLYPYEELRALLLEELELVGAPKPARGDPTPAS